MPYDTIPNKTIIDQTAQALTKNGFTTTVVQTAEEAKELALSLIPKGSEVMTMSSETIRLMGLTDQINTSGEYNAIKPKLMQMDRATQGRQMQELGSAPDYAIGSVHALTQDGKVLVASNTGSQLSAYVYGASHVIWIVGAQKIVRDIADGEKRIYEYILPKESVRLAAQYNKPGLQSNVSKLLIFNKEVNPTRIQIILVNEILGF